MSYRSSIILRVVSILVIIVTMVRIWVIPKVQAVGLSAPTNVVASYNTDTQITLAWIDNTSTETAFAVQRLVDAGAFTHIATTSANAVSFLDDSTNNPTSPPAENHLYQYRVAAIRNSIFTSNPSAL